MNMIILWLKCAEADLGKISCNRFKENVDVEKCKSKRGFSQISAPLEHKMNAQAPGACRKSLWLLCPDLHKCCDSPFFSFYFLYTHFFFFITLKGERETLTQLQLSYFRVTLKLWLRLTNDLPVGISFSAQNWPLKNIVIRHGGDFIGISLFIPVGCQASFCMNHLSKNQWEAFEHHFSWKRTEIPKLHKCIDVCPCVCGWVKWNCLDNEKW